MGKYVVEGAESRLEKREGRPRSSSVPLLQSYRVPGESAGKVQVLFRRKSSTPMALVSSPYLKFATAESRWTRFLKYFPGKRGSNDDEDDAKPESEITKLRVMLFFCILDWIGDVGTSVYYWLNGGWVQATLTFGIVCGAGFGITVGFLKDPVTRRWLSWEARSAGWYYLIPLYSPTLFPFFAGLMRLRYELAVERAETGSQLRNMLEEDLTRFRALHLKANWCETVFEAKPQLLLQLVLLLESMAAFDSPFDFLPVILSIQSLTTVTNTIYTLVAAEAKDVTPIWSKLWGLTYTGVSVGAPALVTNLVRVNFDEEGYKFLSTILSLTLYFLIFELIYFTCYAIWRRKKTWGFGQTYYCVLAVFYILCFLTWVALNEAGSNRRLIVSCLFVPALLVNCIAFFSAQDFGELSFRLKNDKIEQNIEKLAKKSISSTSPA